MEMNDMNESKALGSSEPEFVYASSPVEHRMTENAGLQNRQSSLMSVDEYIGKVRAALNKRYEDIQG